MSFVAEYDVTEKIRVAEPPLIGIVGGYGGVGQATAQRLHAWGLGRLRIGGPHLELARQFVNEKLAGEAEYAAVDVTDGGSLAAFCAGCHLIVNCTGPSFVIQDKVALAALAANAHYVDPGGEEAVYQRLAGHAWVAAGRAAILSAGIMPGLSGLLARWLARQGFARSQTLTVFACLKDRFTPAAAREYILSLSNGYGESLAAWRNGSRVSRALQPLVQAQLPFFSRPVDAHPYLSREAERLAQGLGLDHLSWYNIFDGRHVSSAIGRLQALDAAERYAACTELIRAAELDLFGQKPYQIFLLQLEGEDRTGVPLARTLLFRATDSYSVSGAIAAIATAKVLGGVSPGVQFAMDALDPADTVEKLRRAAAVTTVELIPKAMVEGTTLDEGSL